MNTQLVDQHWFISLHGKRYGPYTFAALVEAASKGVITAETSVWRLGWQQWHPAEQVPGLIDVPPVPGLPDPELPVEQPTDGTADADEQPSEDEALRRRAARLRARRRDEDGPSEAPGARRRRPSQDEVAPADTPRSKGRRASPDDDADDGPRRRDRWSPPDEADDADEDAASPAAKPGAKGRDERRGDTREGRRGEKRNEDGAAQPRDRWSPQDEEADEDATPTVAKSRAKRSDERRSEKRDETRDDDGAARPRDRWAPRDEDAPAEAPKPRERRPLRGAEDLDAPTLRDGPASEDDDAPSDAAVPSARRPSWDDDTPSGRRKRPSRDDDASLDQPRIRDKRSLRDTDALGDKPKRADRRPLAADEEDGPVDEWGVLDVRPSHDDDGIPVAGRSGREKPSKLASLDVSVGDAAPSRVSIRPKPVKEKPSGRPRRSFGRRLFISLVVILLLAAAGWGLFASGLIALVEPGRPTRTGVRFDAAVPGEQGAPVQPDAPTQQGALTPPPPASGALTPPPPASGIALPDTVVTLPAVVALSRSDPAAFERFKRRFADAAVNAKDDEILSVARAALRKSVKRLLANAPGDTLLEITEAYLAYMQGLQSTSPESCVALSDESKGAKLTSNLAKQFPIQFIRDMSVLERVASISPNTTVAPLTVDEARPFLETVFNNLRQQPVKSELLGRDKLNPTDFQPYCTLVIAFYQAVLELPRDDKVKLLRYLYASAATDPDSDLK